MAHDISDATRKPDAKIPCLGCGQRDGLIAPIEGKPLVLWCMRCGSLIDTEEGVLDTLVPQLCVHVLSALGHQPTSMANGPAEDKTPEAPQPTPDSGT